MYSETVHLYSETVHLYSDTVHLYRETVRLYSETVELYRETVQRYSETVGRHLRDCFGLRRAGVAARDDAYWKIRRSQPMPRSTCWRSRSTSVAHLRNWS